MKRFILISLIIMASFGWMLGEDTDTNINISLEENNTDLNYFVGVYLSPSFIYKTYDYENGSTKINLKGFDNNFSIGCVVGFDYLKAELGYSLLFDSKYNGRIINNTTTNEISNTNVNNKNEFVDVSVYLGIPIEVVEDELTVKPEIGLEYEHCLTKNNTNENVNNNKLYALIGVELIYKVTEEVDLALGAYAKIKLNNESDEYRSNGVGGKISFSVRYKF